MCGVSTHVGVQLLSPTRGRSMHARVPPLSSPLRHGALDQVLFTHIGTVVQQPPAMGLANTRACGAGMWQASNSPGAAQTARRVQVEGVCSALFPFLFYPEPLSVTSIPCSGELPSEVTFGPFPTSAASTAARPLHHREFLEFFSCFQAQKISCWPYELVICLAAPAGVGGAQCRVPGDGCYVT